MAERCYETTDEQEAVLEYMVSKKNESRGILDDEVTTDDLFRTALDELLAHYGFDVTSAKRQALVEEILGGRRDDLLISEQEVSR